MSQILIALRDDLIKIQRLIAMLREATGGASKGTKGVGASVAHAAHQFNSSIFGDAAASIAKMDACAISTQIGKEIAAFELHLRAAHINRESLSAEHLNTILYETICSMFGIDTSGSVAPGERLPGWFNFTITPTLRQLLDPGGPDLLREEDEDSKNAPVMHTAPGSLFQMVFDNWFPGKCGVGSSAGKSGDSSSAKASIQPHHEYLIPAHLLPTSMAVHTFINKTRAGQRSSSSGNGSGGSINNSSSNSTRAQSSDEEKNLELLSCLWTSHSRVRSDGIACSLQQLYIYAFISYGHSLTDSVRSSYGIQSSDYVSGFQRRFATLFLHHSAFFLNFSKLRDLSRMSHVTGRLPQTTLEAVEFLYTVCDLWMNRNPLHRSFASAFIQPDVFSVFLLQGMFAVLQNQFFVTNETSANTTVLNHASVLRVDFELECARSLFVFLHTCICRWPLETRAGLRPVIQLWLSWILPGFSQDRIKQFGANLRGMADDESKKPEPHSPAIFVDSKPHISADDLRLGSARAQSFILSNFAFFVILFDEFLRNFVRGGRAACENAEQLKQITKLACVLSGVCDTLEEFGRLAREVDPHQFKKQSDKSTRGMINISIQQLCFGTAAIPASDPLRPQPLCKARTDPDLVTSAAKAIAILEMAKSSSSHDAKFKPYLDRGINGLKSLFGQLDDRVRQESNLLRDVQPQVAAAAGAVLARDLNNWSRTDSEHLHHAVRIADPWRTPPLDSEIICLLGVLKWLSDTLNNVITRTHTLVTSFAHSDSVSYQPVRRLCSVALLRLPPLPTRVVNLRCFASTVTLWWVAFLSATLWWWWSRRSS